ncbi:hypothetical protein SAMN05444401_3567 [Clostridium amylolyticum]|uniref:Uncharacterized protein n=1 Tax=Clostridium amylolyticum TaxID=1121298 RepID=A0A1M6L0V6_9CLOT|nr:hypothetical protein [Clostridium amylolyticum]SHJ64850.1 hypothetical protein SAMN05444401_3567 [Clostridium amylolyticum]
MEKICACCGMVIEEGESYFKCLENFLLVKFFDSEEDNIFCSKECFCEQLFLEEIDS